MRLTAGARLRSVVCDAEVIVVKAPDADVVLECGGQAMLTPTDGPPPGMALDPGRAGGTQLGKRYRDEALGLEVLCTKGGRGELTVDGRALPLASPKPLPASD